MCPANAVTVANSKISRTPTSTPNALRTAATSLVASSE
ncbi:Uncharacterised protein [Mycobacterium tuberculosis]|uniref:Uncharacterized protein n=1 Tax=Mycobacterium tuberculosis TaxID=1773 RepID=A0A0T7PR28_MYCTX|nr:Uncharacterised protein [Mycobacterium tuberculosis]COW27551.1 Uncharacterised protein [Mycobacterium tuberculosis]COY58596.1 Uncharacterised protein [Mycobacterium tuberculosis]COY81960.1 Uncharacterised protein [Mycobacterium tuberculosis]COZ55851.1 Uncharacterised protein [Mycobacterium tuberculosis]